MLNLDATGAQSQKMAFFKNVFLNFQVTPQKFYLLQLCYTKFDHPISKPTYEAKKIWFGWSLTAFLFCLLKRSVKVHFDPPPFVPSMTLPSHSHSIHSFFLGYVLKMGHLY